MTLPKPYYDEDGITIYNADCRDILPHLGPVDLVLTDPPYSISTAGKSHFVRNKNKGSRRLAFFTGDDDWDRMNQTVVAAIKLAIGRLKKTGTIYIWAGHRQIGALVDLLEKASFHTRIIAWVKKVPVPAIPHSGFDSGIEIGIYGYLPNRTFHSNAKQKSNVVFADSFRHGQPGKVDHPTQKPFAAISPFVEISSNEGDSVLDPFMGSGTTLVACKNLKRKAIGIEIEQKYCDIAIKRLRQQVLPLGVSA